MHELFSRTVLMVVGTVLLGLAVLGMFTGAVPVWGQLALSIGAVLCFYALTRTRGGD